MVCDLKIGIDLDNTIIDYNNAFYLGAKRLGLLRNGLKEKTKKSIKSNVIENFSEEAWMRLQGKVYGEYLEGADLYDGILEFLEFCQENSIQIKIISHKTEFGHFDETKTNLRDAALAFLGKHDLFRNIIDEGDIIFCSTLEQKLDEISKYMPSYFIDDLLKVLNAETFPKSVERVLFCPEDIQIGENNIQVVRNWTEIKNLFL